MSDHEQSFESARKILEDPSGLLENIMFSMGDGLSIQDRKLRIVYQNQFMVEHFGSHVGEYCHLVYENKSKPCEGCPIIEAFRSGKVTKALRRGVTRDGKPFRFENIASPLKNEQGEIVAGMELCRIVEDREKAIDDLRLAMGHLEQTREQQSRDIEARIRMEAALQESKNRYAAVVNTIPDLIWLKDSDGKYLACNPELQKLFGASESEIIGKSDYDFVPRDLADFFSRKDKEAIAAGRICINEEEVRYRSDGRHAVLETRKVPVLDADGGIQGVLGIGRDITERKRMEEKLRFEEKRLRDILGCTSDWIWEVDAEGRFTFCSEGILKVLKYRPEEILGRTPLDLMPPNEREDFRPLFLQLIALKAPFVGLENWHLAKDGQRVCLQTNGVPLLDEQGNLLGYRGADRDITVQKELQGQIEEHSRELERSNRELKQEIASRKLAEESALRAKEKADSVNRRLELAIARANELATLAEAANKAKSEFLANMSHEIRTPLNGIIGMTGLLMGTALDAEQREYAEIVDVSGKALIEVINDILDFSKIEAGKLELEIIDFDIYNAIQESVDILAQKASDKGLELACFIDQAIPSRLRGDPGRLRQILVNLGNNAVKFTPSGEVIIRVEMQGQNDKQATLRFSVSDTGIGIAEDRLRSIFEAFTQADASTTRHYGGTGLGLTISNRLCEMMEGKLRVKSESGRGSSFWFTLAFDISNDQEAIRAVPACLQDRRVLVVDDNDTNRKILAAYLAQWGCRHECAPSGEKALFSLERAAEEGDPFEIAIVDMIMPGIHGEQLGKAIRKNPALSGTHLLMLTSLGMKEDSAHAMEIGFEAYLTKPVKPSKLFDCLVAILEKPRREAAGDKREQKPAGTRRSLADSAAGAAVSGGKARILLAEDNAVNQKVALNILNKIGFKAEAVANGKEAVEALRRTSYDLILMDCQMPEMDGYEATAAVRKMEGDKGRVPVIAMTANAMKGDEERCLAAGMDDYIAKPVEPEKLLAIIEKWLN